MADGMQVSEERLSPWLGDRSFDDWYAEYDEVGYVIFKNVLSAEEVETYHQALEPYMLHAGRNDFEGLKSNRVYALLAKDPVFANLIAHPLALAFVERELGPTALLSACLAIMLHPGETVQPWHTDDGSIHIPPPRPAFGVSTFWALSDTTETNGATEVLPYSHTWAPDQIKNNLTAEAFKDKVVRDVNDDPAPHPDAVKAVMPSGSFMVAKGTLLHRGGANKSDKDRTIITPQYCAGWARQLENMMAVTPRDVTAKLPKRVRELMGYSIHPPFMGYVDGVHPEKLLEE